HKTLPTITFNEKRIDSIELYPYKKLINEGLSSVMVAHLNVPSLEPREGYPSSLSQHVVTDILKNRLGVQGLIFTDALTMQSASNIAESGAMELELFKVSNDVMWKSEEVPVDISKIVEAYTIGDITVVRLPHSVKTLLEAKYKLGFNKYKPVSAQTIRND